LVICWGFGDIKWAQERAYNEVALRGLKMRFPKKGPARVFFWFTGAVGGRFFVKCP